MTVWEGDGREEECSNEVPCRPLVLDGSMVTTLKGDNWTNNSPG